MTANDYLRVKVLREPDGLGTQRKASYYARVVKNQLTRLYNDLFISFCLKNDGYEVRLSYCG